MRTYSEQELGALIQRATELQQGHSNALERGLSTEDVERIATELGIAPAHLRTAILELENRVDANEPDSFWGTPFQIDLRRVVGGELTDEKWEEVVLLLRKLTGRNGQTNNLGNTKEWSHFVDEGLGRTRVSITPRDEESTIEIQKHYRGIGVFIYAISFFIGFVVPFILLEAFGSGISLPLGFSLWGAGIISSLLAARAGLGIWTKKQRKKLNRIINKVFDSLSVPETIAEDKVKPAIELPDLSEETASTSTPLQHKNGIKA